MPGDTLDVSLPEEMPGGRRRKPFRRRLPSDCGHDGPVGAIRNDSGRLVISKLTQPPVVIKEGESRCVLCGELRDEG